MTTHPSWAEASAASIARLRSDTDLQAHCRVLLRELTRRKYAHNFTWMGRPIIQCPQDVMAMQELIWSIRPDVIIETGVAHGGSLILYASILELIGGGGRIIGVDIDIRAHNRVEIEKHPMAKRITLVQGSSVDPAIGREVAALATGAKSVMVVLDSNHTHDHVLKELELYSPLVTKGSYLVVMDTVIDDMPDELFVDRPWRKGNSPKSAVHAFLAGNRRFAINKDIESKLLITVAPDGYLECIGDRT
jgi:cephalosporin hydroxylase